MTKKFNVNSYIIIYLIGYSFYFHQIYTQILYPYFSLDFVLPFSLGYLLMPLFIFYVCKKLHSKANVKIDFIYKILSIIYLFITSLIILNYVSVMIHNYYYQDTNSLIISIFLLLPLIYVSFKTSNVYYSLTSIILIIFICFKLLYGLNMNTFDMYPLYNTLFINDYLKIIILTIPIILEPLVLLSNNNMYENSVNYKVVIPFAIIISLISIFSIIRQTIEFGLLLEVVSFPYYESCKLVTFESNFDNIDYYYLFSLTISIFARVPLLIFTIKDSFNTKNKQMLLLFAITLICLYFLIKQLEFYTLIILPLFYICSIITITLLILSFFMGGKRHAK